MPNRPAVHLRVECEQLEDRLALSSSSARPLPSLTLDTLPSTAVTSSLKGGVLAVFGTATADAFRLRVKDDLVRVAGRSYSLLKIRRVVIVAEDGADVVRVGGQFKKPCRIFAGPGNDQVSGGGGNDVIYGETGNDTIQGGGGKDLIYGGTGSNVLSGGPGVNKLVPQTPLSADAAAALAAEIMRLINATRLQKRLLPLAVDARLAAAAGLQAGNMACWSDLVGPADAMRHTLPGVAQPTLPDRLNFVGFAAAAASENIAFGFPTAADVVNAWLNSPEHRDNILQANVTRTGIAVEADCAGVLFFSQVFASPRSLV